MRPLSILLWASLLLPAAITGLVAWQSHDHILAAAAARGRQTATILREHALRVFEAQQTAISSIDARIAGLSWEEIERSEDVHRLLESMADASPHIDGLWLSRPDGRTVNSADFFPMPPADVTEREYYRVLRERDVTHLGQVIQGRLKGNLNFNISRRRSAPDGSFDGLILVTITLGYFEAFWKSVLEDGPHIVAILRGDGEILARYPGLSGIPPRIPQDSPFFELIAGQDVGTYKFRSGSDGRERLYAFAQLGDFPAYMIVGLDRWAVLAPWRKQTVATGGVAALASLALAALVVTARRRENRLSEEVERRRQVETSLVAKEEHVAALERAKAALRESEERFRTLFETLTQGVVFLDGTGTVLSGNAAAETILGVTVAEMAGRKSYDWRWNAVDADERPLPPERFPSQIALRTGRVVRGALMGVHNAARGERRWIVLDAIPQRRAGESAPSSLCLLFSDVTEKRRSEDTQRLLIGEVDHRAKNALAVVQAVIRLTHADTPEQFVEAVEGRVGALARAHTLLARSRWEGADIRTLIKEELDPYRAREGDRVTIDGPSLVLCAHAAQPLGMVLHELATNAAKYGALSVPTGKLAVAWVFRAETDTLELRWEESGGPPVVPPARSGFGSMLIETSIAGQLQGEAAIDWAAEGIRAVIRLPAEHLTGARPVKEPGPITRQPAQAPILSGLRVLLAEDNAVVAMELCDALAALGCSVVGPASTVEQAERLASSETVDAAILDIDLQGRKTFPVADLLAARDVPVMFCTGFSEIRAPGGRWADAPVIRKPCNRRDLAAVLADLVGDAGRRIPAAE